MSITPEMDPSVAVWFQKYRESYKWPMRTTRLRSEQVISNLQSSVCTSIIDRDGKYLLCSLVDIHNWKTKNRSGISTEYKKYLSSKHMKYFEELFDLFPFDTIGKLHVLIRKLRITNCNLPVCSAMASFIYGRQEVPIIDRLVAQFFSRHFNVNEVDEKTARVMQYVKKIPFKLEYGGTKNLRLAVYTDSGFEENLSNYLEMLIPECCRIAEDLRRINIKYCDIHGKMVDFYPVDVEMAIFSYAMQHPDLF